MRHGMPDDPEPDLPPGVRSSDLPGNRPEDYWGEMAEEELAEWFKDEFDTVDEARAFLDEQWNIQVPDDCTEYTLITLLVDDHQDTVRTILGWDEDHQDDDLRDIQKDNEAMRRD